MSRPFPSPETLAAWDLAHVWHPFTQQEEWEAEGAPLIIDGAEGCELIDVHGKRYLDGISSLWTNVHGHRHPKLDAAVQRQLRRAGLVPDDEGCTNLVCAILRHVRQLTTDRRSPLVSLGQDGESGTIATSRYPAQRQEPQAVEILSPGFLSPIGHRVSSVH